MWILSDRIPAELQPTRCRRNPIFLIFSITLLAAALQASPGQAQNDDLTRPNQHFSVQQPRDLEPAEAMAVYQNVRERMFAGYGGSRDPAIENLSEWPSYNSAPYLSATHGQRYVNNYANELGRSYGRYEGAGPMPVGAVLAKDSFTVTRRGDVFAAALFLMEKMPAGFNQASHDWRYTMILPDGSLFGMTNGEGSDRVAFCITCHEAVEEAYHQMFFVPKEYRVELLGAQ